MAEFLPITDPITGTSVRVNETLVSKYGKIVLPSYIRKTVTYDSIGLELPIPGARDVSNLQIQHLGEDEYLAIMSESGLLEVEVRFTQNKVDVSGKMKTVGGVCYVRGYSKGMPESNLEVTSSTDNTVEIIPVACKKVVDGKVTMSFDIMAGVAGIGDKDERSEIESLI